MKNKGRSQMVMAGIFVALLATLSLVIAGTTDTFSASATLGNTAPDVTAVAVQNSGTYNPTSHTTTAIAIRMTVTDTDGWGDINLTAGASSCNVTNGGVTHTLGTCSKISNSSATTAIFECTGTMNYYDLTGSWSTSCKAIDNGALSDTMAGSAMTYNRLDDIFITSGAQSWPGLDQTSTNVKATGTPVVVANYGNAYFSIINITAYDLDGVTNPSDSILASDTTANDVDASGGDALADATPKQVTDAVLLIGGGASESVYLYLEQLSNAPLDVQSYTASSAWVVTVSGAANSNP